MKTPLKVLANKAPGNMYMSVTYDTILFNDLTFSTYKPPFVVSYCCGMLIDL